jgi:DNA-binding transcriptional ArsR family regulator
MSADAVFGALADPTRRRLLTLLDEHGPASATELARELPMTRQAIVKHLGALADAGLVDSRRDGRAMRFHPTPAPMSDAVGWMADVGAQWDDRLATLRSQLDSSRTPTA